MDRACSMNGWFVYSCCSHLEHRASMKCFASLQFLNLRHSVGLLARVISLSQGHYLTQTQNKHKPTSMPRVRFEPTTPAFEQAKTVHALDHATTVINYVVCMEMRNSCTVWEARHRWNVTKMCRIWGSHSGYRQLYLLGCYIMQCVPLTRRLTFSVTPQKTDLLILKQIFTKWGVRVYTVLNWLRTESSDWLTFGRSGVLILTWRPTVMKFFIAFFSPSRQCDNTYGTGPNCFLPQTLKFIITVPYLCSWQGVFE
jgi:hypothetical protein